MELLFTKREIFLLFHVIDVVGTLDEHMHLLLPALIRLFKVDAPTDIRCAAIRTLTRLIPRVQVHH